MLKKLKKFFSKAKPKKKAVKAKAVAEKKPVSNAKKKTSVRKPIKRSSGNSLIRPNKRIKEKAVKPIGKVTHFYGGIKVAVIKFSAELKKGTEIRFKGATTDFAQKLESMQYDHKPLAKTLKGKQVGVKVKKRVRDGDMVYLEK